MSQTQEQPKTASTNAKQEEKNQLADMFSPAETREVLYALGGAVIGAGLAALGMTFMNNMQQKNQQQQQQTIPQQQNSRNTNYYQNYNKGTTQATPPSLSIVPKPKPKIQFNEVSSTQTTVGAAKYTEDKSAEGHLEKKEEKKKEPEKENSPIRNESYTTAESFTYDPSNTEKSESVSFGVPTY